MSVPGINTLALALSIQGVQKVMWYENTGRTTNSVGKDVPEYADAVAVYGSFQPMSRTQVEKMGFDLQEDYATFFASKPFSPVGRDGSGDQFTFGGSRWQAMADTDWFAQDGWDAVFMVRVGPDV